jgi:flagellar basal body-associated protein FliL
MTGVVREEDGVDRSQDQNKKAIANKKALRYVMEMTLVVIGAVLICLLVWWFTSNHSYDTLGRTIVFAGGLLLLIGVLSLGGHSHTILKRYLGTKNDEISQMVTRGENFQADSRTDAQVTLNLLGSGLLCLFIGNMIVQGL